MTQIEVRSELRGEMRTKLNGAINKGIDMINKALTSKAKLEHVNVNGVIMFRSSERIDVKGIVGFLTKNENIKKFATFHCDHIDYNMPATAKFEVHHITDGKVLEDNSEKVCNDYMNASNDKSKYYIISN